MPKDKKKRGWTLPGYNYLGPFNSLNNGVPTNKSDQVAQTHDYGYDALAKKGINPYLTYNVADEEANKEWGDDWGGRIANAVFDVKKFMMAPFDPFSLTYKNDEFQGAKFKDGEDDDWNLAIDIAKSLSGNDSFSNKRDRDYTTPERPKKQAVPGISPEDKEKKEPTKPILKPLEINMPDTQMSERDVGHKETDVSKIPLSRTLQMPWAPTEQFVCHYRGAISVSCSQVNGAISTITQASFRLNSPADCLINASYTAWDNNHQQVAIDAAGSRQIPSYWKYWREYYQFYHVRKSNFRLRFIPTQDSESNREATLHVYLHGASKPPLHQTSNGASAYVSDHERNYHPGHFAKRIRTPANEDNIPPFLNDLRVSGDWSPGSIKHDVIEDEDAETWTPIANVPKNNEILTLIVQPSDDMRIVYPTGEHGVTGKMIVEIDYIVQAKCLKDPYRWFCEAQSTPAVTDAAAQATE